MQIESLEICGKAAQNVYQSDIPKVKAYVGKISPGKQGLNLLPMSRQIPTHRPIWRPGVAIALE